MERKVTILPARPNRIVKSVGIYCRVSTNKSDQLNSLTAQVSALTRVISQMDQWELTDTFIDIASAKEDNPRKEFERMLQAAESHQISVIVTKSISRFGRDTVDTLEALQRLRKAGVTVHFTQEKVDTSDMSNDLLISVVELFAQAENEERSENIRMGLTMRALTGKAGNLMRRLYGYDKSETGELVINEEQARVVRKIYRWYLDGASVKVIVSKLRDENIPSPRGKEEWSKRAIEKMLTHEKYTGKVVINDSLTPDQLIQATECIPPIITESEFKSVQEERKKRSNVEVDEEGNSHRKNSKYSSKKKSKSE